MWNLIEHGGGWKRTYGTAPDGSFGRLDFDDPCRLAPGRHSVMEAVLQDYGLTSRTALYTRYCLGEQERERARKRSI